MKTTILCPNCGKPLAPNAPKGLCPACLLRGAFPTGTEPGAASQPPRWQAPSPEQLKPHFAQLEILELVGVGGMGAVYKAVQKKLGRAVALKILPLEIARDAGFAERFNREARALALLNHPNIVTVYDFGQSGAYYYFIMEFVEGTNLRRLIQAKGLEPRQALDLVAQICTALQFAHDEKIVHRDIKPDNILISKKGRVKIADFGLAKLMGTSPDANLTASEMIMGTLNYMAPEQRENSKDVDHRADIYSLGVVFYEMLTGEVPMGRFDPPSKKVRVDVRLDEVVLHALEREPERRYQQASEVRSQVEAISAILPQPEAGPPGAKTIQPKPAPKFSAYVWRRFVIGNAVYLLLCLVTQWAMGDVTITVDPHAPFDTRAFLMCLMFIRAMFSFYVAGWLVPLAFVLTVYNWLVERDSRGLSLRQCPPWTRRRHNVWSNLVGVALMVVAVGSPAIFLSSQTARRSWDREFRVKLQQATEYWFAPRAPDLGLEKLGLNLKFSAAAADSPARYSPLPPGVVTLAIYRTNESPAKLTVNLPGLRAHYRIPLTNTWDYGVVLNPDDLANWLQKGGGLNPSAPGFAIAAKEIYNLFAAYQSTPPETVPEFFNAAKAVLRDFSYSGSQSESFFLGVGPVVIGFWCMLGTQAILALAALLWVTKRTFRDAWTEIEAGRWSPPMPPPSAGRRRYGRSLAVLAGITVVPAAFAAISAARGQINDALLIILSWGAVVLSVVAAVSREQIKAARKEGLWPQLGEIPTVDHVQRLAAAGETILAIKLYRTIHRVSLAEARAAVEKLGK